MSGTVRSLRAELLVLRRSRGVWILVLVLPTLTLLNRYLVQYVYYRTAGTGTFSDLGSPLQILYTISPNQMVTVVTGSYAGAGVAAALLLGALSCGNDWGQGRLKTSLVQGPARGAAVLGQALAVIAVLVLSVALNFGVCALASKLIVTMHAADAPESILAFPPPMVTAQGIGIAALISATYGTLGLALGAVFRSAGGAVGAALIWFVGAQLLLTRASDAVGGPFAALDKALPSASTTALAAVFGPVVGGPVLEAPAPPIDPTLAPWILLAYLIALTALSVGLTRHRDIT